MQDFLNALVKNTVLNIILKDIISLIIIEMHQYSFNVTTSCNNVNCVINVKNKNKHLS